MLAKHGPNFAELRLDSGSGGGARVLTPIRPIMVLSGNLDLGEATVKLM